MIQDTLPPQTPQPTTGPAAPSVRGARPRWIIAAVVAVLIVAAGIGVVAGLGLNARRTGGSAAAAASYVPADATVYYELRLDLPGDQRASFEQLLGHFPSDAATTLLTGKLDELLDGPSPAPSGPRYSTDVKPWFDGSLAAAMIGYPTVGSANPLASMPKVLVFAGVRDETAANAAFDRFRAESGLSDVTSTTHDGATIWTAKAPSSSTGAPSVSLSWTVTADEVVMGTASDLVANALDVHAGSAASLAARQEFRDGLARLPADRVMTYSIDTAPILAEVRSALASAMPSAGPVVDAIGAGAPQFIVGSARIQGDRLVSDVTAALPSGSTLANRDAGLAAAAPADALVFSESHDVGASLARGVDAMQQIAGRAMGSGQLDQLSSILGGDLSSFVSWMGDAAIVAGETGSQPYAGLIITPTDGHEARVRLLQLQGLLQLGAGGGPGVTVTDADHNGTTITTIVFKDVPADAAWAGTIQYAATDSRVVIGTGTSFVARVLDMKPSDSLAAQARFKAGLDAVGGARNTGLTWVDLAGIRSAVESARGTAVPAGVEQWIAPFDYLAGAGKVDAGRLEGHAVLVVK